MPDKKFEEPDVSPMDDYILDSIIEEEVEFALWMQDRRLKTEMKRALNPCGMSEGGTFGKGNSCAGTKGAGKKAKKNYAHDIEVIKSGEFLTPAKDPPQYRKINLVGDTKNADYFKVPTQEQVNKYIQPPKLAKMKDGFFVRRKDKKKMLSGMPFMEEYDGKLVHARIDIPAYKASKKAGELVYAVTLHYPNKAGSRHAESAAYLPFAVLDNVSFIAQDKDAALIQQKFQSKSPIATVAGKFNKKATLAQKMPEDIENWTPVGYNPSHATFFYDKRTGKEVVGGGQAISVGNTVFVKKAKYGDRDATKKKHAQSFPAKGVTPKDQTENWNTKKKSSKGIVDLKEMSEEHDLYNEDGEVNRALNSCGMTEGGTFGKGNSCAGTKGKGKTKPTKTGKKPKKEKYTKQRWKTSLNAWMDGRKIDSSKFWDKAKGTVALPDMDTIEEIAAEQAAGKPDKETEKSYVEFKSHLISQYESLLDAGLVVKAWEGEGEPYKVSEEKPWVPSSNRMREMVEETGEFYFFMTEKGFGEEGATEGAHPFLQMSPVKTSDGKPMLYNDVFRVVHDAVAHLNGGFSFSTRGEMNAMLAHASTLPKDSWPALWAETFAQNAYYEVHKTYAEQTYYSSKFVGLIEELQKQGEKKLETARGLGVMTHSDEDGECGCNRKRRSRQARLRYYAKRFLANKSKPIERFTKSPMKKSKGKVGGCGNSGQGFVAGNTCAKGTAAGPVAGQKAAGKPSDKHPNTTKVFDAKTAKAFLGSKKLLNIEDYQKQVEKDIKKVTKLNDVFVVPLDKDGKISGEIVQIDHRMRKPDGTKYDVLGIGTGEYRLEVIPIADSPTRKKDIPQKLIKTPVRKDNLSIGKKYKKATKSMTAKQTAAFVQSFWKDLTKEEQKDAQKYIQYKGEVQAQKSYKKASAKKTKGVDDFETEDKYFAWKKKKLKGKSLDDFKTEDEYFDALKGKK